MSGRGKHKKAKIHMEKPELPAFLQRMKEQIVADEDTERRERSDNRRRARPDRPDDPDDDPTVIKLHENDLTEAEFKRMKAELESQIKFGVTTKREERKTHDSQELDIDLIIRSGQHGPDRKIQNSESSTSRDIQQSSTLGEPEKSRAQTKKNVRDNTRKVLSYGSSSEDEEDD